MSEGVKYRGNKINLGGVDHIVPALSIGQAASFDDQIIEIQETISDPSKVTFTAIKKWMPVFLTAFKRNYPQMEEAFLEDNVDLNNFMEVREAVLGHRKETAILGE